MTNEEFMEIEKRVYRGGRLDHHEFLAVMKHARELQQKVFCGDVLARAVEDYLSDIEPEKIPHRLQWMFATYVCAEPKTKLNEMEITPSIVDTDTP